MEKLITYIADDGTEFDNEEECLLYERVADPDCSSVRFFNHNLQEGLEEDFSTASAMDGLTNRFGYDCGEFAIRAGSMYVKDAEEAGKFFDLLCNIYGITAPEELVSGASYAYDAEHDRFYNLDELIGKLTAFRDAIRRAAESGEAA